MVLVAVGEDDRLDVVGAVAQVGEVGQDEVDAEHLGGRELEPGVDDDDLAAVFDDRHVLADLPQPAERDDAKLLGGHRLARRDRQADALERRPDDVALGVVELDHRQPHACREGIVPVISSAAFIGIGLVVTASAS